MHADLGVNGGRSRPEHYDSFRDDKVLPAVLDVLEPPDVDPDAEQDQTGNDDPKDDGPGDAKALLLNLSVSGVGTGFINEGGADLQVVGRHLDETQSVVILVKDKIVRI